MTVNETQLNREQQIEFFTVLIKTLDSLSPLGAHHYDKTEMQRMALLLYDYLLEEHSKEDSEMQSLDQMVSSLSMPYPTLESDTDDKMKFIVKVMDILDFNDSLRPWILDHPIEPGEDIEDSLPDSLATHRIGLSRSVYFRIMAHAAFALGVTLSTAGNLRHSYHMSVCAITIYKVISRAGPRSSIDKIADASTNLIFYREITVLASTMGETEHALEYATKLVAFHEIAVAESLGGFDIDSAAGDADMAALKTNTTTSLDERPLPRKASINLNAHFDAQILLADASMKATNYATAVHAFTRAIQLFDLQDSMATEEDTNSPSSLDNILELKRRLHLKKEICLKLVDANENLKGDASVSFIYSRTICELCTTKAVDDSDFFTEKEAVDYMFMAGVYAYRYALQLAGGVEHASSPPVAILATPNAQKTMPIRTILDESIQYLLKSQHNATLDTSDPKSKRSISFQLAILYTDIREEEKARALLKEFGLTNTVLHEIDLHRRRSRSNNTGEGYSLSLISPFEHVVYSLEAFKRLVGLSPSAESLTESATPFRLTLSSNRRMTIAGDHFLPIKAVCAHCCMTFTSDDPIKCSECATQRIYVYYCTEECATENKSTHDQDCIKGNTLGNSSEFSLTGMTGTFSTLLNGNL